jgi:hypothetical protein
MPPFFKFFLHVRFYWTDAALNGCILSAGIAFKKSNLFRIFFLPVKAFFSENSNQEFSFMAVLSRLFFVSFLNYFNQVISEKNRGENLL